MHQTPHSDAWCRKAVMIAMALLAMCVSVSRALADDQASPLTARQPIFLAFGGYGSCLRLTGPSQSQVAPIATRVMQAAKRHGYQTMHVIYSCFHMSVGNEEPQVSYTIDGSGEYHTSIANFLPRVRAYLSAWDAGRQPVFVVGHSYGAWLAMRLATSLPPAVAGGEPPIAMLTTVDPINYEGCNAATQKRTMVDNILGVRRADGCNHFSDSFALPRVGLHVRQWMNYYQDRCHYLHGVAMGGATNILENQRPVLGGDNFNGLEELVGTQFPGVDTGRVALRDFLARVFTAHDDLNFIYHTAIVSLTEDRIIHQWEGLL